MGPGLPASNNPECVDVVSTFRGSRNKNYSQQLILEALITVIVNYPEFCSKRIKLNPVVKVWGAVRVIKSVSALFPSLIESFTIIKFRHLCVSQASNDMPVSNPP